MHINDDAVSFAAFSLAKILAAEMLRKGILDHQDLVSAVSREIERQQGLGTPANEDAAVLLTIYRDEIDPPAATSMGLR